MAGAPLVAAGLGGAEPLHLLRSSAVGGGVLVACALIGGPVVRWLRVASLSALDRVLLALGAGTGILGLVVLGLGALRLLHPPVVLIATFGLAGVAAVVAPPWRIAAAAARESTRVFRGVAGTALAIGAFLGLSEVIALSAAPVTDWDSLMYHLRVPRQFLEEGRIFLPPDNPHVAHVGAVHMLYIVARALGAPQAAGVISGLFSFALGGAVFRAAARGGGGSGAGRLAVAGLMGSTVVAYVAFTPRVDATLAFFLFLAHAALVQSTRGGPPRLLIVAGLMAGCAIATKIHAAVYLIPLGLWVAWLALRRRLGSRTTCAAVAAALLLAGPWLSKNWVLLGDPVYPLLRGERLPAWLEADERVRAVSGAVDREVVARAREPFTLRALVFAPASLSPEREARWYLWSPLLLVGLWTVVASRRALPWVVPAVAYLFLLLLRSPLTNLRYLVAALPALAAGTAIAVAELARRFRLQRWIVAAFAVASALPFALPLRTATTDLRGRPRDFEIHEMAAAASRRVPEGGHILMLYDARGYPFERSVTQDNIAIAWPLLERSGFADRCLEGLDFSHVLLNKGAVRFYLARGSTIPEVADGSLRRFIERCLEPEEAFGSLTLYRLRRIAPRRRPGFRGTPRRAAARGRRALECRGS